MNSIDFAELTRAQVEAWRDFVEASGPSRLKRLAEWMSETDGPLLEADGSVQSLDTVWAWLLDVAGKDLTSSRETVRPTSAVAIAFGLTGNPADVSAYAGELIEHYLFEVLRRLDSTTSWEVHWPKPKTRTLEFEDFRTGINFRSNWIDLLAATWISSALRGNPITRESDYPRRYLNKKLSVALEADDTSGASILAPLVGEPLEEPAIPSFGKAREPQPSDPAFGAPRASAIVSHGTTREDLTAGQGLPAVEVEELLATFGLSPLEGQGDSRPSIDQDGFSATLLGGDVGVESFVSGRKITAIVFEPLSVAVDEWRRLSDSSTKFAESVGGKFIAIEE